MTGPFPTRLIPSPAMSELFGLDLTLISELDQHTHSFKFRAAWNVVGRVHAGHFIAASSGNFGQALAKACQLKGRECTIVMPTTSAKVKIESVKSYGATVVLVDTAKESRADKVASVLLQLPADTYLASAYDCDHVIEGNSSLGRELAVKCPDLDVIIAPVGGGGLSSGIIKGLCECGSFIPVYGAEPLMANDAAISLRTGILNSHDIEPQTLADGARTISLGLRNFKILSSGMSGIFEVTEKNIIRALQALAMQNIRIEPTAGLSVGALFQTHLFQGKKVGCVLSGGNVDEELYQELLSRDLSVE